MRELENELHPFLGKHQNEELGFRIKDAELEPRIHSKQ